MLRVVNSGFQTGADIAGIKTAKRFGLITGGLMTKGFRTTDGPKPEYVELYGAIESYFESYPYRTERNVINTDATLALAYDFRSRGEILTKNMCDKHRRPYKKVDLNPTSKKVFFASIPEIIEWLTICKVEKLNIAGNSTITNPNTEKKATMFLEEMFRQMGFHEQ